MVYALLKPSNFGTILSAKTRADQPVVCVATDKSIEGIYD